MKFQRAAGLLCAAAVSALLISAGEGRGAASDAEPVPIRIGWQIPAATQAQIVQVLKRTDILDSHGLDPSLVPFSYGGPQVDAAFAGKLDVFFSGDQPAINLIARGGKWKIVGRIFYDRIAFIVPPNSPIQTVADLQGKIVASPFGSVAHREAFLEQRAAGLDEGVDVENRNLDILEISQRVMSGGIDDWNGIDAAVVWEPIVSRFELEGLARSLTSKRTLGVVSFSDEFIARHPEAAVQFLVALIRAWDFFAQNPDRVRQWYIDDTQLDYTPEALISGASVDPNFSAKSVHHIDLELTDEQIEILEQGAAWRRGAGKSGPHIRRSVDRSLLTRAMQEIASARFEEVRILLPSTRESPKADTDEGYMFDRVPLWVAFSFMVAIALLAIELGFWLGRRSQRKLVNEPVRPVATVVGAVLGMMAFVIALTFGSANSRFDARKAALLDDVTAIQTAYLRANLLPEPQRTTVRSLLRDYVEARVGIVHAYGNPTTLRLVQRRAEALQESMWSHVETLVESGNDARIYGLFASALNEVFGLHTRRVVLGAHYRIPGFVWCVLISASCVAMVAVGFQFGMGSNRRVHTANFALSVTFALVMLLAFDLDRAGEGLVAVNQQPMIDLYQSMSK